MRRPYHILDSDSGLLTSESTTAFRRVTPAGNKQRSNSMKRFTGLAAAAMGAAGFLATALTVAAGTRELSFAAEDAAYQAVMQMATDSRVNVKKIAFVKLMRGSADISEYAEIATVFENGLVQAPTEFQFLTHQDHAGEWAEVDRFFDAATDFGDYDPKTLPRLGVFKMADAFAIGQVLGVEDKAGKASVRVSLRLIRIDTAERLWAGTVEGIYDDPGPEYEVVNYAARNAIDLAVQDAITKADLSRLSGYQVLVVPFAGPLGRAMTEAFIRGVSGKDASVSMLSLPNGSASDRMTARFLRERAGTNRQVSNSVLKRMVTDIGGARDKPGDKVAVLKGGVSMLEVSPLTIVDPVGACISKATASYTPVKVNLVRVRIGMEAKFLDINNNFAGVANAAGIGDFKVPFWIQILDQLQALSTFRNIVLAVGVMIGVLIVGMFLKQMFRVR